MQENLLCTGGHHRKTDKLLFANKEDARPDGKKGKTTRGGPNVAQEETRSTSKKLTPSQCFRRGEGQWDYALGFDRTGGALDASQGIQDVLLGR
jgi:hypothetical protein